MKIEINEHYLDLKERYLFSEIARRVSAYSAQHPDKKIIRLGIGDVTLPLAPSVIAAMSAAVQEMADKATFRGYAPEYGYDFLRQAISLSLIHIFYKTAVLQTRRIPCTALRISSRFFHNNLSDPYTDTRA